MSDLKNQVRVRAPWLRISGITEGEPRGTKPTVSFPFGNPILPLPEPATAEMIQPEILREGHHQRPPRSLIGMSFRPGIPWQVALQQSLPPLSQPGPFCNNRVPSVQQISADGACLTSPLSQKSPQSTFRLSGGAEARSWRAGIIMGPFFRIVGRASYCMHNPQLESGKPKEEGARAQSGSQ
jgi:hypothetical protein